VATKEELDKVRRFFEEIDEQKKRSDDYWTCERCGKVNVYFKLECSNCGKQRYG
jgi:membrane protease subunit (stomatin/prohibitin family)